MAAYTETFIGLEVPNVWRIYTVPEDMRVVVMTVVGVNVTNVAATFWVKVHGIYVAQNLVPAYGTFVYSQLRLAVYERQTVEAATNATGMSVTVSGYIFEDKGAGPHPPGAITHEFVDELKPLPA